MINSRGVKYWRSTTVGIITFILGIGGLIDCWIGLTDPEDCGTWHWTVVVGLVVLSLMFLFLDEEQIRKNVQSIFSTAIGRVKRKDES